MQHQEQKTVTIYTCDNCLETSEHKMEKCSICGRDICARCYMDFEERIGDDRFNIIVCKECRQKIKIYRR